ncbi:PREDICTED: 39S ribosomal protein L10, mitochondrial [Ceratosolen solmsi marchali]|uniref:Large ribosomal subunit protein uL10m n=1 Tax=Ceratosolen solmsi marchali TaxID=326594 RepID=A0AAJ6VJJ6_9HYME|nr:PREDICTED: 39S ribosomal protein L10, mitochondrial [Ceratosolen solmsi marchali]
MQQKRFRSKINIQKPRAPHHERGKVEKFITPFISNPDTHKPLRERCLKVTQIKNNVEMDKPYDVILSRECLNWFKQSNMVALFHVNSITSSEVFEFAVAVKKANMHLKGYQNSILRIAYRDSIYQPLTQLIQKHNRINFFVFSQDTDVSKLLKILKRTPQLILLAGIIHQKLLNHKDFVKIGTMNLVTAQAGLVNVLHLAAGQKLRQQLTHHQSTLVTRLKQIGTKEDKPCDANE